MHDEGSACGAFASDQALGRKRGHSMNCRLSRRRYLTKKRVRNKAAAGVRTAGPGTDHRTALPMGRNCDRLLAAPEPACGSGWASKPEQFRKTIKIVVIDPSAPYASGIRAALPDAKIAVDKWHLVALHNQMLTQVRATRHPRSAWPARQGRRPGVGEPAAAARRRTPFAERWNRITRMLDDHDLSPWGVKERLRMLLAESQPSNPAAAGRLLPRRNRRPAARSHRLAETIQTWWPAILITLTEDASNARTEGLNWIIKQTKRIGCGIAT
jgi:transposase